MGGLKNGESVVIIGSANRLVMFVVENPLVNLITCRCLVVAFSTYPNSLIHQSTLPVIKHIGINARLNAQPRQSD